MKFSGVLFALVAVVAASQVLGAPEVSTLGSFTDGRAEEKMVERQGEVALQAGCMGQEYGLVAPHTSSWLSAYNPR